MNWKDTVIKSKDIKWIRPRVKNTDDGRLDFDLHLPFTELFHSQAKFSFAHGVNAAFAFYVEHHGEVITPNMIEKFLIDCGLPDIAKQIKGGSK